jgi:hypothetical protein
MQKLLSSWHVCLLLLSTRINANVLIVVNSMCNFLSSGRETIYTCILDGHIHCLGEGQSLNLTMYSKYGHGLRLGFHEPRVPFAMEPAESLLGYLAGYCSASLSEVIPWDHEPQPHALYHFAVWWIYQFSWRNSYRGH